VADSASSKGPLPTGLALTGIDPKFREDPHGVLDRLRAQAPVHYDPTLDFIYVTRHADAKAMLADKNLSRDPRKAPPESIVRLRAPARVVSGEVPPNMMWMDDPEHRRQRGLVAKVFTLRAVEALRPSIQKIVDDLLNTAEEKRSFDGIADFAVPLPISVLADLFGFPRADWPLFYAWSKDISLTLSAFRTEEEAQRLKTAESALETYLRDAIAARRKNPGTDLISGLVLAQEGSERLDDAEIASVSFVIVLAGNVTTTDLIGNSIVTLLDNPKELARLRAEPALIKSAVEELLRYNPPVAVTTRHPLQSGTYLGCPVKAGTGLVASILAANRDPEVFAEPHALKLDRNAKDHLAFGGGVHHCIGAPLARLETEIALLGLFTRFPRLRLATRDLVRKAAPTLCGYEAIPLVI
jgi:hypothetical protein